MQPASWSAKLASTAGFLRRRRYLALIAGAFAWLLTMLGLLFLSVGWGWWAPLPDENELATHQTAEATQVFSVDGVQLGTYHLERRTSIPLADLPPHAVKALLATEDRRFYRHDGIDTRSLFRVLFQSILLGDERSGGGSTVTQQLAKAWYPRQSFGLLSLAINKFREMHIAQRIEAVYDKAVILEAYLNTVSFGEDVFGLQAASQRYFSKSCRQLRPEESALLIGMLQAPTRFHPLKHPTAATNRRNEVLHNLAEAGHISEFKADSMCMLPLRLQYQRRTHHDGQAPYFREHLRQELQAWSRAYTERTGCEIDIYRSGLKVYTTIHSRLQDYAEQALKDQMRILQKKFDRHWQGRRQPAPMAAAIEDAVLRSPQARAWKTAGWSEARILESAANTVAAAPPFRWEAPDKTYSLLDSVTEACLTLHAGLLAIDPGNGHLRAWVGGIDHHYYAFDQVTAPRQTGSVFKPLLYAAAIESGEAPCRFISNEREIYEEFQNWNPRNSDNFYGGHYSMEGALMHSVNVVAARTITKIGVSPVIALARRLGIEQDIPEAPAIALGAADVSLKEMLHAYCGLTNGGRHLPLRYLLRIEDREGNILADFSAPDPGEQVISPETSQMLTYMLQGVVNEGTGKALRTRHKLRMPLAGKTGTAQNQTDGWFVAVSPALVVGVRVGAMDPRIHFRTLADGQGATTALPIVGYFLQAASDDREFDYLERSRFIPMSPEVKEQLDCETFAFPLGMSQFKAWYRAREIADSLRRLGLPVPDSTQLQSDSYWAD